MEQEKSCSQGPVQPAGASAKQKVAQQHASQVPTDQSDKSVDLQKQMSDLMAILKSLEQKVDAQQQAFAAANISQSSAQHNSDYDYCDSQNYDGHNQRGKGRGYGCGQWRGGFGRGNSRGRCCGEPNCG